MWKNSIDDGPRAILLSLKMPEEVSENLLNVDHSVLNELILKPRRQLVVKWLEHERFVARLPLLHLNCVDEVVPLILVKSNAL